jgi:queuine tRNA-ribosyltransferase
MPFSFALERRSGDARAGVFSTPHGGVPTPCFMPVGTQGTVKALDPADLEAIGATMVLGNAYHLHLRPGDEIVRELGGLGAFMRWPGPTLTDSGGFQVFSLATLTEITDEGATFRSHLDGSLRSFTPESVMRIERNLGADVVMQFDHVIAGGADHAAFRDASERSLRWLERCRAEFARLAPEYAWQEQTLFPIVQGGTYDDLRRDAMAAIGSMGAWDGYAIGGLSVGEAKGPMYDVTALCAAGLPEDRPRYLMGVGFPEDLVECVARGVDLFDCVAPTRMGRTGAAFTQEGRINVKNAAWRTDRRPLDAACTCSTCARFDRAYIRHLFHADELLGFRLLTLHNVHFLLALMREARAAITGDTFPSWADAWLARYRAGPPTMDR